MDHLLQVAQQWSVVAFLVGSMVAIGLNLTPRAILAPLRDMRLVLRALALNFLLAPAFAWLLITVIPLDRGYAIGLMLLGGAAGAPFLPKLVETAHADQPLAVALMVLLTIGTILFIPFALPLMIPGMQADAWSIARPLLLLIVLPLVAGMVIKRGAGSLAKRAAPIAAGFGNISLALLFVLLLMRNVSALLGVVGNGAILAALIHILGLFAAGWLLGGPPPSARGVFALAAAARNFGAALAPAAGSFKDPKIILMIIVSAIVCLVVTFCAAAWVRRRIT